MIRIMDTQNKKSVQLSKEQKTVFRLLGVVIADNPDSIKRLLLKHGVQFPKSATKSQLVDAAIYGIEQKNENFNLDLAAIFAKQVIPDDNDNYHRDIEELDAEYDNFIEAITGALSSVSGVASSLINRKQLKNEARTESRKSLLQFQAQKDQLAAQQKAAINKAKIIKIVGGIAVLALFGGIILWQRKKKINNAIVGQNISYENT